MAPLRDVREKANGEPLPAIDFPTSAFATDELPREHAWDLFRELRADERLKDVAVLVARSDAEALSDFWENACPAAAHLLSMRASTIALPSTVNADRARQWVQTPSGRSTIARVLRTTIGADSPTSVEWTTSLRQAFDDRDLQTVYVIDVEPWAAPIALSWLFTPKRWNEVTSTLRAWHEAHGFGVVALGADVLEAWVERPPATEHELTARLIESVAFCGGYLDEGLAHRATMLRGHAWHFRFDI